MLLALGLLALGALVLYLGAESALRGAGGLARAAGIPAFALGALLFGVDLEGLGAAVAAAAGGDTALAAGEIFGSVLFLFSAAFGAALIVAKRPIPSPGPLMVLAPAAPLVAGAYVLTDRYVSRPEGALLLVLYGAYVALVVREGRAVWTRSQEIEREAEEAPPTRAGAAGLAFGGLILVALGAAVVVAGADRLADLSALSSGFVGAAILGVLVSLDEVLLAILPVRRGVPELATGNLFGTLAAFSSGVLGISALVRPLVTDSAANLAVIGCAVLYAMVATVFMARGRAGWGLGLVVLATYGVWLVVTSAV